MRLVLRQQPVLRVEAQRRVVRGVVDERQELWIIPERGKPEVDAEIVGERPRKLELPLELGERPVPIAEQRVKPEPIALLRFRVQQVSSVTCKRDSRSQCIERGVALTEERMEGAFCVQQIRVVRKLRK